MLKLNKEKHILKLDVENACKKSGEFIIHSNKNPGFIYSRVACVIKIRKQVKKM